MSEDEVVKFRQIKPEIRVLGVDDGDFTPHAKGVVDVVGVVYRGGYWLDGVMRTQVEVDGTDATEKIAAMVTNSPHYDQLRVVILDGVTFAGFNVVDIKELFKRAKLPIITITRKKPNLEEIRRALENLPQFEERWKAIENTGETIEVYVRESEHPVYMQIAGISEKDAEKIVKNTATRSNVPEALRVAHIIASGLAKFKKRPTNDD